MVENTKTKTVIDASAILSILFTDEKTPQFLKIHITQFSQGRLKLLAPIILKYEVANSIKSAVLQKRITENIAIKLLEKFLLLPISYPKKIDYRLTLSLAIKHKLSVYDASYLQLAKSKRYPLLTLDKNLKRLAS
ncbi:MAG: type II toxin-antitoxin system VapC family toxin [Candidatus Beckwithbacteria bacterium]|nr:type II toxin-antitoxin system VapC family toxin [Patescibacteria group bacterium]